METFFPLSALLLVVCMLLLFDSADLDFIYLFFDHQQTYGEQSGLQAQRRERIQ
jgi:hypothetical protein